MGLKTDYAEKIGNEFNRYKNNFLYMFPLDTGCSLTIPLLIF